MYMYVCMYVHVCMYDCMYMYVCTHCMCVCIYLCIIFMSIFRIVLAAQSEYFDSLLFGSMRESEENCEIELIDISLFIFRLLLYYAYTGHVELNRVTLQVSIA